MYWKNHLSYDEPIPLKVAKTTKKYFPALQPFWEWKRQIINDLFALIIIIGRLEAKKTGTTKGAGRRQKPSSK